MGLTSTLAATFSVMTDINLAYIALIAFSFTGQYSVKNWLMPSLSDKLKVDIRDAISGALIALFMGVSVYAATLLTDVEFTWIALWKAVSVAVIGYFTKTIPAENTKK